MAKTQRSEESSADHWPDSGDGLAQTQLGLRVWTGLTRKARTETQDRCVWVENWAGWPDLRERLELVVAERLGKTQWRQPGKTEADAQQRPAVAHSCGQLA